MATVNFNSAGETLCAYLTGEIDHHSAQLLRVRIDGEISRRMPETLILDFGNVGFMDSSGVGLILGRARQMQAFGGRLVVQNPPEQIQKMLRLARIEFV